MDTQSSIWLELVRKFQFTFEHPIAPPDGRILPEPRRAARGSWLLEELSEFISAEELVDQADAGVDFLYFCWGNFVEIGSICGSLEAEFGGNYGCPSVMLFPHRVSFAKRAAESVFDFMRSDTLRGQRDFTADAARIMIRCLKSMSVNPVGLLEIAHDSNMGKIWPSGDIRLASDGKVLKPNTWEPPELFMQIELDARIDTWMDKHRNDADPNGLPF